MRDVQRNVVLPGRRDSGIRSKSALLRQTSLPLPHDTRAERLMLSGLLKEWAWLSEVVKGRGITDVSFYHWHHGLVMRRLAERPGPHGLFTRLHETGEYREWPNLAQWIAEVWELDPTGCDCEYAAVMVKGLEVRRGIIVRCREFERDAIRPTHTPGDYERILLRLT